MTDDTIAPKVGRSIFGRDPAGYHAGRLSYPEALFELLAGRCGLVRDAAVFEIGPGSGQATRSLLKHGVRLTAVEPDAALAATLQRQATSACADLKVINMPFEDADLTPSGFDLGVAATSFGWLDTPSALAKVMTVLRPGGWWSMWWNLFRDVDGDDIVDELVADTPRPPAYASGQHYSLEWDARLVELRSAGLVDAEYVPIGRKLEFTPASLRSLYATFSPIRLLPTEDARRRLDRAERRAEEESVDGVLRRSFMTTLYLGRRP
jgi:SAM-dependent methyltransferase